MSIGSDLSQLFLHKFSVLPSVIEELPPSGSSRRYFRLSHEGYQAIGVWNPDERENRAFVEFAKHFRQAGIPVPEIYSEQLSDHIYLQQDLGNLSLLQQLEANRTESAFPESTLNFYRQSLYHLAQLQIKGAEGLDFGLCYPREAFDHQSLQWDLNYFKYYCLKFAGIPFDEQKLEDDFDRFSNLILTADADYFMFRDFQARNIMVQGERVWFIDFQGGRKGALQYDLASLLWQAKADLPHDVRESLLEYYISEASKLTDIDAIQFRTQYYLFVYARTLQVLGAYGYRGIFERKPHFIASIPYALENLRWLLENHPLPEELTELNRVLPLLLSAPALTSQVPRKVRNAPLVVSVCSFSYLKGGYPEDKTGHGGGYVFDCRAIFNPGRFEPYKKLTGRDPEVIRFLKEESEMDAFLKDVYAMVGRSVQVYLDRGFDHLSVAFGCSGGQHRSVFAADALAQYLKQMFDVKVELAHLVQDQKNWINE